MTGGQCRAGRPAWALGCVPAPVRSVGARGLCRLPRLPAARACPTQGGAGPASGPGRCPLRSAEAWATPRGPGGSSGQRAWRARGVAEAARAGVVGGVPGPENPGLDPRGPRDPQAGAEPAGASPRPHGWAEASWATSRLTLGRSCCGLPPVCREPTCPRQTLTGLRQESEPASPRPHPNSRRSWAPRARGREAAPLSRVLCTRVALSRGTGLK